MGIAQTANGKRLELPAYTRYCRGTRARHQAEHEAHKEKNFRIVAHVVFQKEQTPSKCPLSVTPGA